MGHLSVHTPETAPEGAKKALEGIKGKMGFVPNIMGVFSGSPQTLEAYQTLQGLLGKTSFTPTEQQVVVMTASYENDCSYCMAAHTSIAKSQGVDDSVIKTVRNGESYDDPKLQALADFTKAVVQQRGNVSDDQVKQFKDAGYGEQQILEVILGVAMKTISNYTNHIAETPVDEAFEENKWEKASHV